MGSTSSRSSLSPGSSSSLGSSSSGSGSGSGKYESSRKTAFSGITHRVQFGEDFSRLKGGDHIYWYTYSQETLITHHAIVVWVDMTAKIVSLIELTYTDAPEDNICEIGISFDDLLKHGPIYIVEYTQGECFSVEETIANYNACRRLGREDYSSD